MSLRRIFAAGTVSLLSLFPSSALAASAPSLSAIATKSSVTKGESVELNVHVNPNGTAIDTVNVVVSFPADKLKFVSLDKSSSAFSTIIPAQPSASNGTLTFAAANMSATPVTGDSVIAGINFTALSDSGAAQVSFDNSQAANSGSAVAVTTTPTSLSFKSGTAAANSTRISDIKVTNITMSGGAIHWHTSQAANSSINYGADQKYGFSDNNADLTTDHSLSLTNGFNGKTTVHYNISSTTADGQNVRSGDKTFTTLGYTVSLKIVDTKKQPLDKAKVRIANLPEVTTDSAGRATVTNVGSGSQNVVVNGMAAQLINVKASTGSEAEKAQPFELTAQKQRSTVFYIAAAVFIGLVALLALEALLIARRKKRRS